MKARTLGFAAVLLASVAFAARNNAGTYSLPAGNPVVTLTTISSTWANTTLADIATELTNSLDRNGRGAMLAPLQLSDGTVGAPGLTFGTETSSGLYRAGAKDLVLDVNGTAMSTWQQIAGPTETVTGWAGSTAALQALGNGAGVGIIGTGGGTSATGVQGFGGGGDAIGVYGKGLGTAAGVSGSGGDSTGPGVNGTGGSNNGPGMTGQGTLGGAGGIFTGGTSGVGLFATGQGTNANGVTAAGAGSGAGVASQGGGNSGTGVAGQGGAGAGIGVSGQGIGNAAGGSFVGGGTAGDGVFGQAGSGGIGGHFVGAGAGIGVQASNGTAATGGTRQDAMLLTNGDLNMVGVAYPTSTTSIINRLTPANIPKAFGRISSGVAGSCSVDSNSFNVASCVSNSAGGGAVNPRFEVTLASAMSGNYSIVPACDHDDLTGSVTGCLFVTSVQQTSTVFYMHVVAKIDTTFGTGIVADPGTTSGVGPIAFYVFGKQ